MRTTFSLPASNRSDHLLSYSGMSFTKHTEKYVKYTPAELDAAMATFFQDL